MTTNFPAGCAARLGESDILKSCPICGEGVTSFCRAPQFRGSPPDAPSGPVSFVPSPVQPTGS